MTLTPPQKQSLLDEGFAVVAEIIPREIREKALREINRLLGRPRAASSNPACDDNQFWLTLTEAPAITALFYRTPLSSLAESLMGMGKVKPIHDSQIVLRFPQEAERRGVIYHVDGFYFQNNPTDPSRMQSGEGAAAKFNPYAMQICVLLSDVPDANCGNFSVCPSSHLIMNKIIRSRGAAGMREMMGPLSAQLERRQITAAAGSAVFSHYLTMHAGEQNLSAHIRYAVIFRLYHADYCSKIRQEEALKNLWLQLPGLTE